MGSKVWFDAPDGRELLEELHLRCEAGWRYSAADQEEMVAFRDLIKELQALRCRERRRHEKCLERIAEAQRSHNEPLGGLAGVSGEPVRRTSPFETRLFELTQQRLGGTGVSLLSSAFDDLGSSARARRSSWRGSGRWRSRCTSLLVYNS